MDPINDVEADSVTAAASAMAAVAAAAASNSKMSPSAAALFARSTVQKQPLLSAHAPSLPVSPANSNTASDSNSKPISTSTSTSQPAPKIIPKRKDDDLPHHPVNIESLRIDLDVLKNFLESQIEEQMLQQSIIKNNNSEEMLDEGTKDAVGDETDAIEEALETLKISKVDGETSEQSNNVLTDASEEVSENPNEALQIESNRDDAIDSKSFIDNGITEKSEEKSKNITLAEDHSFNGKKEDEMKGSDEAKDQALYEEEESEQVPKELENILRLTSCNESLLRLLVMFSSTHDVLRAKNVSTEKRNGNENENENEKKKIDEVSLLSDRESMEKDVESRNDDGGKTGTKPGKREKFSAQIQTVSDLTLSVFTQVQSEYDAFLSCLPEVDKMNVIQKDENEEGSRVVLDLLPPCYSETDATTAFFRSCSAKHFAPIDSTVAGIPKEELQNDKVHVTSSDGGIEIRSSEDQNSSSSIFSKNRTTSSAMSFVNSIAGAATGVVGGITKRKNALTQKQNGQDNKKSDAEDNDNGAGHVSMEGLDYTVQISREMLGLTVENVLERTIVRTVLANGAAKKAGAKVGSLIVKVGSVETRNLTHFETIDELRQSQRPLKLVLRRISKTSLQGAREEMGRLIKGAGFGIFSTGQPRQELESEDFKDELTYIWSKKRKVISSMNNIQSSPQFLKHTNKKSNYTNVSFQGSELDDDCNCKGMPLS